MLDIFKNKNHIGICQICKELSDNENLEDEQLVDLFGVEVCEGCYYDILNHMQYKKFDDLLDCDKKQLMLFLNKLALTKKEKDK